ncbi:MAG: hypothetical protein JST92_00045 [Deltaproteobacteria bacterium]|nr:hypothetical protein [Deltaproteobacteria bacterium]
MSLRLALLILLGAGAALADPCVLRAQARDESLRVEPPGGDGFSIPKIWSGGDLTITLREGAPAKVAVRTQHLSFAGLGTGLRFRVKRGTSALGRMVLLSPRVVLESVFGRGSDALVTAVTSKGTQGQAAALNVPVPCEALIVGPIPEETSVPDPKGAPEPEVDADQAVEQPSPIGHGHLLATRPELRSSPAAGEVLRVELTKPGSHDFTLLGVDHGWSHIAIDLINMHLSGWVPSEQFERLDGKASPGWVYGDSIGCCAARPATPGTSTRKVWISPGAMLHATAGKAPWAKVRSRMRVTIEAAPDAEWVQVLALPDLDLGCRHEHAWVRASDVRELE